MSAAGVGRPVLNTEIYLYAKRNCRTCHGRGVVLWNRWPQPCRCATRKFLAEHEEELDVAENGDVSWKNEESVGAGVLRGLDLLVVLLTILLRPLPQQKGPANAAKGPKSLN